MSEQAATMERTEAPVPEAEIAELRTEYLNRCRGESLYVMTTRQERFLLAAAADGDEEAAEMLIGEHRGLVAFFVDRQNANGHSGALMEQGELILRETVRDFRPADGNRLADAVCEALEDRLGAEEATPAAPDLMEGLDALEREAAEPEGSSADTATTAPDLMGGLDALERGAKRRVPRECARLAGMLRPGTSRDELSDDEIDELGEPCQAAWDGVHRALAEGGNAHME